MRWWDGWEGNREQGSIKETAGGEVMQYFRLVDDVEIPRRRHLGKVLRGARAALDLLDGVRVSAREPLSVDVTHFGRPLEFCLTSFAVPVATTALSATVAGIAGDDVQAIPIRISAETGFSVLNCTRQIACIDEARSEFTKWTSSDYRPELAGQYKAVPKLVLDTRKIPAGVHFFRIEGWEVVLVVSAVLRTGMLEHGCLGAKFIPLSC